jgi:hypothetical protein
VYLDSTYLDNAIGTARVAALCPTGTEVDTVVELAEAKVESALVAAGYDSAAPSSVYASVATVPKQIKLATVGLWLVLAHARHNRTVPNDPAFAEFISSWTRLSAGELEIPSLKSAVNTVRAVGGIVSTETDPNVSVADGSRPPVFTRSTMSGR